MSPLSPGTPSPVAQLDPISGLPVVFGQGKPVVLVFVRDLHGTTARIAIKSLTTVWSQLDAAGVQLCVISHCDLTYARDYVPRHHVLFPLVCDVDGSIRTKFQLTRDPTFVRSLLALRPSTVSAWFDGLGLGRDPAFPNGHLGADFAYDGAGKLILSRHYSGVLDQPDISRLVDVVT